MTGAADTLAWLADGARSAQESDAVLSELCERLTAAGLPLGRVAVFARTLNPNNIGRRYIWRPGEPVDIQNGEFALKGFAQRSKVFGLPGAEGEAAPIIATG
jgi:hypothetical protein